MTDRQDHRRGGLLRRSLDLVYRRYRMSRDRRRFGRRSPREVFTAIYAQSIWGRGASPFYSGDGSHDPAVVTPYIEAASRFLRRLGRPDVVDVGCGDFAIGSRLRPHCGRYIAADIVEPLINWNRERHRDLGVDFRVLDLATDELPRADVLFVRQVFQHMSNADVGRALRGIAGRFRYLVATDHIPASDPFPHNLDKGTGSDIRLYAQQPSGVVLTSPPFNLAVVSAEVLCEPIVFDGVSHGRIRTIAYELP